MKTSIEQTQEHKNQVHRLHLARRPEEEAGPMGRFGYRNCTTEDGEDDVVARGSRRIDYLPIGIEPDSDDPQMTEPVFRIREHDRECFMNGLDLDSLALGLHLMGYHAGDIDTIMSRIVGSPVAIEPATDGFDLGWLHGQYEDYHVYGHWLMARLDSLDGKRWKNFWEAER